MLASELVLHSAEENEALGSTTTGYLVLAASHLADLLMTTAMWWSHDDNRLTCRGRHEVIICVDVVYSHDEQRLCTALPARTLEQYVNTCKINAHFSLLSWFVTPQPSIFQIIVGASDQSDPALSMQ